MSQRTLRLWSRSDRETRGPPCAGIRLPTTNGGPLALSSDRSSRVSMESDLSKGLEVPPQEFRDSFLGTQITPRSCRLAISAGSKPSTCPYTKSLS